MQMPTPNDTGTSYSACSSSGLKCRFLYAEPVEHVEFIFQLFPTD